MTLKEFLAQPGWSGKRLAEISGLSEPYISRVANGKHKPNIDAAFAIEKATRGKVKAKSWAEVAA